MVPQLAELDKVAEAVKSDFPSGMDSEIEEERTSAGVRRQQLGHRDQRHQMGGTAGLLFASRGVQINQDQTGHAPTNPKLHVVVWLLSFAQRVIKKAVYARSSLE
jgi:hypothetical protein